ncbi:MAG: V-type ATP synthase subunit D [Chlamydiota bacterium]
MIKLTKNELRDQQLRLSQLQKYLPTLQLKKAMLQTEVNQATLEIEALTDAYQKDKEVCASFQALMTDPAAFYLSYGTQIAQVKKEYENIAGVDIPHFDSVIFKPAGYTLFDTPLWLDSALNKLRTLVIAREKVTVATEKKRLLEKELREVSIRVNLFEKVMIPRTQANIKKIKIFLGDQELAAVSQAKVAKRKILQHKEEA